MFVYLYKTIHIHPYLLMQSILKCILCSKDPYLQKRKRWANGKNKFKIT